jgi:hypothetical protein
MVHSRKGSVIDERYQAEAMSFPFCFSSQMRGVSRQTSCITGLNECPLLRFGMGSFQVSGLMIDMSNSSLAIIKLRSCRKPVCYALKRLT